MMTITEALAAIKNANTQQHQILLMRAQIIELCPKTVQALQLIDQENLTAKRRRGFSLAKIENKQFGYVYYVRYSHNGKTLPTKWCTHTCVLAEAEAFALKNKERLISEYTASHNNALLLIKKFYEKDSQYLQADVKRNRPLCEKHRDSYNRVIKNKFIPYLTEKKY
ncbi:MAG: hypothetical protein Ta2F_18740 [Termitinemataceae bacterium]|nr:MAG: hypothetical protein Ta2F_18740 [Termitinemataceae bacterium]